MNNNPYSYDEILCIVDFIAGLERHTRLTPDTQAANLMGINLHDKILGMNHAQRIDLLKEVVSML